MVLWDSRTIHCGVEPVKKLRTKENFRSIIYVCYMPTNSVNDKILEKRIKAFEDMRTTSHWANKCKLFPKTPRTYGGPLPEITKISSPLLTDLGRSLVGYNVNKSKK
jgi:hypothetical protein